MCRAMQMPGLAAVQHLLHDCWHWAGCFWEHLLVRWGEQSRSCGHHTRATLLSKLWVCWV